MALPSPNLSRYPPVQQLKLAAWLGFELGMLKDQLLCSVSGTADIVTVKRAFVLHNFKALSKLGLLNGHTIGILDVLGMPWNGNWI